jgi:hypothetical protein
MQHAGSAVRNHLAMDGLAPIDDGAPSAVESDGAGTAGAGGVLVDCAKAAIAMQNQPAAMTTLRKYFIRFLHQARSVGFAA